MKQERSTFKRILSFVLALVMIVGLLPQLHYHVHAATALSVENLTPTYGTASASGSVVWSWPATNSVEAELTGAHSTSGNYIKTDTYAASSVTLTLKNTATKAGVLSFGYTTTTKNNKGTITITYPDGTTGEISGTGSVTDLAIGASQTLIVTISVSKGSNLVADSATNTTSVILSNIKLEFVDSVSTTFTTSTGGSYTVNGTSIASEKTYDAEGVTTYSLKATPDSGYTFVSWYNETENSYIAYTAEASYTAKVDSVVYPVFVPSTQALFRVNGANFADLNEADTYAKSNGNLIVLHNNGTIAADSYTISSGNTLLIPYNSSDTVHTTASCVGLQNEVLGFGDPPAWVQPTAYRTLTMADGTTITVNGAINVGGQHHMGNGSGRETSGAPTGPLGFIDMKGGSEIILNSGSTLYAWGYITGAGEITAKSGSTIWENIQFSDFRGGSAVTEMAEAYLAFPMSQYYVQNIEVLTTYEAGAIERAATSVYMSKKDWQADVVFIGEGGMFQLTSGSITKDYIESEDRLEITANGNATLGSLSMSVNGISINSAYFVLPINSNIDIIIGSGTTTVNQSIALLPGSTLTVDKDATLVLSKADVPTEVADGAGYVGWYNFIVYDADNWTWGFDADLNRIDNCYYVHPRDQYTNSRHWPVKYAPGRKYNRTEADLTDVVVDVNGTVIAQGYLYTTASEETVDYDNEWGYRHVGNGASIISSGKTGKIVMENGAGQDYYTYQANFSGGVVNILIPMASAMLQNGDGSYTETYDAVAGTTYNYCATHDRWYAGSSCDTSYAWSSDNSACTGTTTCGANVSATVTSTTTATCTAAGQTTYTAAFSVSWATTQTKTVDTAAKGHKDENIDHACDNGCDVYQGTHADGEDANHLCDYCDGSVGENCYDTDKKHVCDECGGNVGTHADGNDADHLCDYCNGSVGESCYDEGKDHICDECGGSVGTHADSSTDGDHVCDYGCGEVLEGCSDGDDENHNCDVCNKENISDHSYEAVVTAPTCTAEGYTTHTCTTCGNSYADTFVDAMGHKDEGKDHICDNGCGVTQGDHADGDDADHLCDYCNGSVGENCYDDNSDHKCDECSAAISSCADTDADHYCDYTGCKATLSDCADPDYDHICDHDGCQAVLSQCSDGDDADHDCDYTGCGKTNVDTGCYDNNSDHKCDECSTTTSACVDSDKNHECDYTGCLIFQDTHADSGDDDDHFCDYCQNESDILEECTDGDDENHNCDVCNKDNISDHSYEAVVTAPTCTEQGYTTLTCSVCGDSYTDSYVTANGHSYESVVTVPTCTAQGYTTHTCSVCGNSYKDAYVAIDANNHISTGFTYTDNGETHTKKHTCCDVEVETVEHAYTDGKCVCGDVQQVTVTWKDSEGKVIDTETVDYGDDASTTVTAPDVYGYTSALDTTVENVTENTEVKVVLTPKTYAINWFVDDELLETTQVRYDSNIITVTAPEKTGYTFLGWYDSNDKLITAETTYSLDNVLIIDALSDDEDAVISGSSNFFAKYQINSYTVTWSVNGVVSTESYEYNTTPSYTGSTDKAYDENYHYFFAGWDADADGDVDGISVVTGDVTYAAVYTKAAHEDKASDSDHVCDYGCDAVLEQCADVSWNYTDNGDGTHDASCSVCHLPTAENVKHQYGADGTCVCKNRAQAFVDSDGSTVFYYTLTEAVEAAQDGDTVTLLTDASGAGVVIDKSITIDFDGHIYTLTEPVGSIGTVSNGFQLLEGNDVKLLNGTLTVSADNKGEFYILIQNYANLTLTDMTLDGTNLDKWSVIDGDSYVLSNNSGTVNVNGKTNITANDEGDMAFAFDVCKYGSYDAPTVNVNTTGTISGKIEVSESISTNLNISGGTFTVALQEAWCAAGFIPHANDDDTYGVKQGTYIAEVSGKKYETLAEAVAAANDGDTITVLQNITLTEVITITDKDVTIKSNESVVITANGVDDVFTVKTGGTLTFGANLTVNSNTSILWANGGTIHVDGAKLNSVGSVYVAALAENGGIINISHGEVTSTSSSAVLAKNNGAVNISGGVVKTTCADPAYCAAFARNGGVVNVTGGNVSAVSGIGLVAVTGGKVTVSGGTVSGVVAHENANAKAEISGGIITGSVYANNGATLTVSGGSFTQDVTEYCVNGYHTVMPENGEYYQYGAHSYTTVVTDPTCTEGGYTTYICACGTYVADEEPALGHTEGPVQFSWNSITCKGAAYWICECCGERFELETETASEMIPGTCQSETRTVYTATAELDGETYTNTFIITGAYGDHNYVDGECEYCHCADPAKLLRGDVDLDGDVDAQDLTLLARHVGIIESITNAAALANADVNGDGNIDSHDLTLHARYVAGIITTWDDKE